MNNPLVSIVIPTYNRAHLIHETLDSVLAQAYINWECIIVDDGSTDNTEEVVKNFVVKDARFQYHKRPIDRKKGANASRNFGFELSKGEYVMFLDADDLVSENCFKNRVLQTDLNKDSDILVFTMLSFKKELINLKITNRDPQLEATINLNTAYLKMFLVHVLPWTISCPLWKRDFFKKVGGFNEELQRLQDVELHVRALLQNPILTRIHQEDSYYRIDDAYLERFSELSFLNKIIKNYNSYIKSIYKLIISKTDCKDLTLCIRSSNYSFLNYYVLPNIKRLDYSFLDIINFSRKNKIFTTFDIFLICIKILIFKTEINKIKNIGMYSLDRKINSFFKTKLNFL